MATGSGGKIRDFDDATIKMIQNSTLGAIEVRNNDTTVIQHDVFLAAERHASDVAPEDPDGRQLVIGIDADDAVIAGGPADDTVVAGLGHDQTLTGGGGGDVFVLSATGVHDTITDFSPADDTLQFAMSAADFRITAAPDGHAVIQYGDDVVDLLGVAPRQLSQANFDLPAGSNTGGQDRESHFGGDSGHHRMFDH